MSKKRVCLVWAFLILGPVWAARAALSPVGWWSFDEKTGTVAADLSPNKNDGTLTNGPTWVAGQIEGGVQFDGNNAYVNLPIGSLLSKLTNSTFAIWANYAQQGGAWQRLFDFGTGETVNMFLTPAIGGSNTGQMRFAITISGNGAESQLTAPSRLETGWHHIAVAINATSMSMQLFLDGDVVATAATRTLPSQLGNTTQNWLGRSQYGADAYYVGTLDDFRIYDQALNQQQIQDLITKGTVATSNKAEKPNPADGTMGVNMPLLQWTKSDTAMFHNVYLGSSPDLTEADLVGSRLAMTMYYHIPGLTPGATYYWRVDEIDKDGVTTYTGDVWSFVTQALTAYYPSPADMSNTASPSATLTWMAGSGATKHHVYFGDNLDAVTQGTTETDKGTLEMTATSFTPPALESLKTYYWRVDEILTDNTVKTGPVWKFTTTQSVDDFESYTDFEGSLIYETWTDGYTNNTGSTVGYAQAPFAEQTIVHGGLQSMPLDYNNADAPFYSEAEQDFETAQDWTAGGVDTLVLFVRGRLINRVAPLYVGLEDASQNVAVVIHPDAAIVTATKWIEWKIPLSSFTGVNLAKVKKIYIGAGDRQNPVKGGTGRLYIDDIGLAKP
jgi:hypothetical protein